MYALVAAQLLALAAVIAPQELNRALDPGTSVDVELIHAHATRDPFRGAHVFGESSLDLDARALTPAPGLVPGDRVVVFFTVEPVGRPRIFAVERGRRAAAFSATGFSVPGRIVGERDGIRVPPRDGRLIAQIGTPPLAIELDLPRSIPVDDAAMSRLTGPALVAASLHGGFLGRPYFADVRLAGRAFGPETRLVWDEPRQRLLVLVPRPPSMMSPPGARPSARTDLCVFDAAGKEVTSSEIEGRVADATLGQDGQLLVLMSESLWQQGQLSLARIGEGGRVLERTAPIAAERVLGFDGAAGGVWILAAPGVSPPQPPHFVQRLTLGGLREPRLGPFDSRPRAVRSAGADVWVVETERHRITRLEASTGRLVHEYRELNSPADVMVDGGTLTIIEANRTQLTRLAEDGRVLWRVPRFQGLAWAIPEPGTGAGWVGATTFAGAVGGVLKFGADGAVTRVGASLRPQPQQEWQHRAAPDALRTADGRIFVLEPQGIAILGADGATATRLIGFRFPGGARLRS